MTGMVLYDGSREEMEGLNKKVLLEYRSEG